MGSPQQPAGISSLELHASEQACWGAQNLTAAHPLLCFAADSCVVLTHVFPCCVANTLTNPHRRIPLRVGRDVFRLFCSCAAWQRDRAQAVCECPQATYIIPPAQGAGLMAVMLWHKSTIVPKQCFMSVLHSFVRMARVCACLTASTAACGFSCECA